MAASGPRTGPAIPPPPVSAGIHFVVGVSMGAVSPPRLTGRHAITSADILRLGHGLQVAGVHTGADTAEMVEHKTSGDTSVTEPIRHPVCFTSIQSDLESAVSGSLINVSCPNKAVSLWSHLRPEALLKRLQQLGAEVRQWITMSIPAVVVRFAPPVGLVFDRLIAITNSARGGCVVHMTSVSHVRRVLPSL